jgi:hypothetical protein
MEETSWTTLEDGGRRAVVHDHRWLAIVGVPLAVFGLVVAAGPWFIEEARNSGAWPILAVGSLIGAGIIVAGLALCFKYEEVAADRGTGVVIRHMGLPPFRRSKTWPLTDFTEVVCLDEKMAGGPGQASSLHHRVRLLGPNASVLVASWLEPEPIRAEARAWARFLDLPLRDTIGFDLETQLRDSMARR